MGNVKRTALMVRKGASAYRIIEDTLNLRDTRIFDYVYDEHGNKKRGVQCKGNYGGTGEAGSHQAGVSGLDMERPRTAKPPCPVITTTLLNSVRPREYDGSHITSEV